MKKLKFIIKYSLLGAMLAALFCSTLTAADPSSPTGYDVASRPNIIVILADDMGYSDLGCYGGEIQTPNIDALAREGVRFTGFKNTARCTPSRASLLTGRYSHSVGVGAMQQDQHLPGYRGQLSADAPTIAEILKPHGYATGVVGKWHQTVTGKSKQKPLFPLDRGFDFFYGTWWGAKDYFSPKFMMKNSEHIPDSTTYPADFYLTYALSDSAIEFVDSQLGQKNPFFLYLAHYAPHAPIQAPADRIQKCMERYKVGFVQLQQERFERQQELGVAPDNAATIDQSSKWNALSEAEKNEWVTTMATYAAMIEVMDEGIGQLIDVLKKNGQYDNTLILVLSDNGSTPNHKGTRNSANLCAALSNTPFSGVKAHALEGGISSPLIVSWPDKLKEYAGQIRNGRCHIIDILPTCLEAAGVKFPDSFKGIKPVQADGINLMAAVKGAELENRPFFWEHLKSRAVYRDGWKLLADKTLWKLYDLSKDPGEQCDLSSKHPERASALKALWTEWAEEYDVIPWPSARKKFPAKLQ
ncbi:arylsulfatase [Lentisphaera marina]|uniref:arylsulfatase n=1 Tax=Lentisphaera marina TaxID=1111041 RepID=UPI0023671003|nr:arylsulfatase [Lentisphaera marina]MDD7985201.1 arylsulfatase [Lentisphaera marina]